MVLPSSPVIFLLRLTLILLLIGKGHSQTIPRLSYCYGFNYTSPSSFETNLRLLLSNLSITTASSPSFFSTSSVGTPPSRVFGIAQCRPDSSPADCRSCLDRAAAMAVSIKSDGCGRNSSASLRYNYCLLRYSDNALYGVPETLVTAIFFVTKNTSDYPGFSSSVEGLLNRILPEAASSELRYAVATPSNNSGNVKNIYGMAWCTMDLQISDCYDCLSRIESKLDTEWTEGEESKVSCMVKFSTLRFYSIPLPSPPPAGPGLSKGQRKSSVIFVVVVAVIGSFALAILFTVLIIVMRRRKRGKRVPVPPLITSNLQLSASGHNKYSFMKSIESLFLDLDVIRTATMDFSKENKLGEGGFGAVYKGVLDDGQEIAVKRLSRTSSQGLKQLRNEVGFVAKLQHRNLVKLLGYCLKDDEMLLVYEYLPNNSLDKYLSDPVRLLQLDWKTRYRIIEGIARGLLYLHEDSRFRIIHRDLKSSNILLDIQMNPKISDFGIAKLFNRDETRGITSQVAGTFGYMSPEYALHGSFSPKSDVYSYGVLVLEIISGRFNSSVIISEKISSDLLSHVWHCWNEDKALKVVDRSLGDRYPSPEALRCIQIGLLCIQEDPSLRPSMSSLLSMLTNSSVALSDPMMPTFLRKIDV